LKTAVKEREEGKMKYEDGMAGGKTSI